MTVDVVGAVIFLVLVYLGWRSGALRQVFRVVALVAVVVGVPFVSPLIRQTLFEEAGRSSPGVEVLSMVAAGLAIYLVVFALGWVTIGVMRTISTTLSLVDRTGGALIGAVKAALVVYLMVVAVVFLEAPIDEVDPDDRFYLRGGWLTDVVMENNILAPWQFPDLDRFLQALAVGHLAHESGTYEGLRHDGYGADFLRDERVQELLEDEVLRGWVEQENYPMVLADSRVREVLNDPAMMDNLTRAQWKDLRRELTEGNPPDDRF